MDRVFAWTTQPRRRASGNCLEHASVGFECVDFRARCLNTRWAVGRLSGRGRLFEGGRLDLASVPFEGRWAHAFWAVEIRLGLAPCLTLQEFVEHLVVSDDGIRNRGWLRLFRLKLVAAVSCLAIGRGATLPGIRRLATTCEAQRRSDERKRASESTQ
jgi:hypothetical protein